MPHHSSDSTPLWRRHADQRTRQRTSHCTGRSGGGAAATGTAYAVTTAKVNIADGTTPAQVAHVDAAGHLLTTEPVDSIDSAGYVTGYQVSQFTYLTSPTTASLALSSIRISNPALNDATVKEQIELVQVGVDNAGKCNTTATKNYGYYNVAAGQESLDTLTTPLLINPPGGAKYCLALYMVIVNTPSYYVTHRITAHARTGTDTGIGVAPNTARTAGSAKIPR